MKRALVIVLLVAGAGIAAGTKYTAVRADLVAQRAAIHAQWSEVDQAIQHRADLAPQWLRATAGFQEAEGLEEELNAGRAELAGAASPEDKVRANQRIAGVLVKFQTIAAGHPKLKSHEVMARLSDAENRIAVERRRYNDMLEHYNAQIQRFPDNIVAWAAGFSRDNAYFPTEPRP